MKQPSVKILFTIFVVGGFLVYFFMKKNPQQNSSPSESATSSVIKPGTAPETQKNKNQDSTITKNVLPAAQTPRTPASDTMNQKIFTFLNQWRPNSEFSIDINKPHQKFEVRGGEFLVETANTAVFFQQLAQVIGAPKNSIQLVTGAGATSQNTDFSQVIEYSQFYKSFAVENSSLKIFKRSHDERVYFITSTLKPEIKLNDIINVSLQQASDIIKNEFPADRSAAIKVLSEQPVIYYEEATPELCWKLSLGLSLPIEERLIYISVSTGKIISSSYSLDH